MDIIKHSVLWEFTDNITTWSNAYLIEQVQEELFLLLLWWWFSFSKWEMCSKTWLKTCLTHTWIGKEKYYSVPLREISKNILPSGSSALLFICIISWCEWLGAHSPFALNFTLIFYGPLITCNICILQLLSPSLSPSLVWYEIKFTGTL